MTEEEKKAIETLQYLCSDDCINKDIIKIIVNLIEKLQKENEELKEKVFKRDNDIIYLEETVEKEFLTKQEVKENYIPKDKIKEKLNWYEDTCERLSKSGIELNMYENIEMLKDIVRDLYLNID